MSDAATQNMDYVIADLGLAAGQIKRLEMFVERSPVWIGRLCEDRYRSECDKQGRVEKSK